MKNKKLEILVAVLVAACFTLCYLFWSNTAVELNTIVIECSDLPGGFNGFKIAHISDLHNAQFGENNAELIDIIKQAEPDIITVTGDLTDASKLNISVCTSFLEEVVKIAPCYYVTGNHEKNISSDAFLEIQNKAELLGVNILRNKCDVIEINGEKLTIMGIDDPYFFDEADNEYILSKTINELKQNNSFEILLSHRPEYFSVYAQQGVDLVLSGHAHGGQIRLPFIGGLFAPHQGLFPEFDGGVYTENNTNMVVSRGIGNSAFPLRVFNRPEVICVELRCK